MTLNAYSIYDNKALVYHSPFFAPTDGAAMRMFADTVNDPNTTLSRHPADYSLHRVGQFDDSNGEIVAHMRAHVVDALTLLKKQEPLFQQPGTGADADTLMAAMRANGGPRGNF